MTEHESILLAQLIERPDIYHELSIDSRHFASAESKRIFAAVSGIVERGGVPDLVSIKDADSDITAATLSSLSAPTTANWEYYQGRILRGYRTQQLRRLAEWLSEYAESDDAPQYVEDTLADIVQQGGGDKVYNRAELVHEHVSELERRFHAGGTLPGYSSGFAELDSLLLGYRKRRYYLVGGRPSSGKSALTLQLADYMALVQDVTVGFITLESAKEELMDRTFANYGNIDSNALSTGQFYPADFKRISDVGERVYNAKTYIYEVANARLEQVMSAARQMVRRYGCEVIFIDYIQLIRGTGERREQVERASMAMKELARQLDVPVIAAAQLRRDVDNRRPGLGDFQHSSQMEQDADAAILIYEDEDATWLHVAKNRDGRRGSVRMQFRGEYVRFEATDA
jgi:replicative DNA helicase